ncbi:hypothetical protein BDZ45DRAFT_674606 [Acephala macrosclerotiorum]|nr:hypothetical protein BDZ45DRAFT_674606 [Acephala macrosclerotiorum]
MDPAMNIKPSARKTHRKTRTGCRTCKSRKIKCDEQRPSCHNCIKHSVQCDFLVTASNGSVGNLSVADTPANHSPHISGGLPQYDQNGDSSMLGEGPLPTLNLIDLELLHNYVTSTAFTLHTDPAMKTMWRINVPQLGFQNDFVMRGILALSALHMARYKPERRDFYMSQAIIQHQAGLRMTTGLLASITKENCSAIYLFSGLTLYFTLASPRKPGDFLLVGENGIADWLYLVKGTNFIIESSEEYLFSGPLGPMFIAGRRRTEIKEQMLQECAGQDDPLTQLSLLISETSPDRQNLHIYMAAIHTLRKSFVFHYKQAPAGHETGDIFFWVFKVPDEYLQLLKQHTQESLAIFAYFCVVLKRLDAHWWMEGWSTHLMARIWNLLDEEHRLWIRWPVEEIGWIPS